MKGYKGVIVVLVVLVGMGIPHPSEGASRFRKILETIGISVAVGTVLGASTLPFYDSPNSALSNVAYGAAGGALVGLGILTYEWVQPKSQGPADPKAFTWINQSNASVIQPKTAFVCTLPLVSLSW